MNLNKVILIGRISQEITLQESKSGVRYVRVNLAVNRDNSFNRNNEEITDFIGMVAFDNNATFIKRFFNKGDLVSVVGSLQSSQYTSKSGDVISSLSVAIDQIKSLEPRTVTAARNEKKSSTSIEIETHNNGVVQENATFYNDKNEKSSNDEENPWELDF